MLSAQEGLSTLCIEVYVYDRGAFLFAEHDERDSLSRPYCEGYGLVDEVVVVRNFLLHVVRERGNRQFFASDRPRDAQVALRKRHPHRNSDTEVRSEYRQYDSDHQYERRQSTSATTTSAAATTSAARPTFVGA